METRSQPEFKLTVPKKWRLLLAAAAHGSSSDLRLTQEMINRVIKYLIISFNFSFNSDLWDPPHWCIGIKEIPRLTSS